MSFTVNYNGHTNEEYDLMIYSRPDYRAADEQVKSYDISGREAVLTQRIGRYSNVNIEVTFNYLSSNWGEVFRKARTWLRTGGRLTFSDDPEVFWNCLYVLFDDNERSMKRLGKFTVTFVCAPGEYYYSGADFLPYTEVLENPYSECRPIYKITGNGSITLTVNGNDFTASVSTDVLIDTDLKVAYSSSGEMLNTAVTGDYDDLVLKPGTNTISVSRGTLTVQPNWRVF